MRKVQSGAAERDEWLRTASRLMFAQEWGARRPVLVGETGNRTYWLQLYAWSPKIRARWVAPMLRGTTTTLLMSTSSQDVSGPCLTVVGIATHKVFEACTERLLAPALCYG
jgi:hypothetical protein